MNAPFCYLADLNTCLAVTQESVKVIPITIVIEQPVHVRAIGVDSRTFLSQGRELLGDGGGEFLDFHFVSPSPFPYWELSSLHR